MKIISKKAISRREYWIEEIKNISGNFGDEVQRLEKKLELEIKKYGNSTLIDHLRLCGNIPEMYGHDTSEEKQYLKYTDALLSFAYKSMGLRSAVLTERADVADVDVYAKKYSFVADAKAFRLSRTAKNQKDFKVQAMDNWKHGKPYAMVVAPIYQLPSRSSQIYQQASTRNVCIFTYSHLSLLVTFAIEESNSKAEELLHRIFKIIPALNPSKSANNYWLTVNKTILDFSKVLNELWKVEKMASIEAIGIAKNEELKFLASEREKIMRMTHDEALKELIKLSKIESKIKIIESINDNGLFEIK